MVLRKYTIIPLLILLCSFFLFSAQATAQDFHTAADALSALDHMGECHCDTDVRAYRYFVNHPAESIPLLIDFTLRNKQRHFVSIRALSKIKDEQVVIFFIELLNDEVSKPNNLDENGQSYSQNGLISDLIRTLGDYGDARAIPAIKEASKRPNLQAQDTLEITEALSKLGDISIDKLYRLHSKRVQVIYDLASSNRWTNPTYALALYDWIIDKFPQQKDLINKCHIGKIDALYNKEEYALALTECETVKVYLTEHPSEAGGVDFNIDHRSYSLEEMIKYLETRVDKAK